MKNETKKNEAQKAVKTQAVESKAVLPVPQAVEGRKEAKPQTPPQSQEAVRPFGKPAGTAESASGSSLISLAFLREK